MSLRRVNNWSAQRYANAQLRWNIEQRFEHFSISFVVDAMVVTMLLRLVHRQQRQLRESEARYRGRLRTGKGRYQRGPAF